MKKAKKILMNLFLYIAFIAEEKIKAQIFNERGKI